MRILPYVAAFTTVTLTACAHQSGSAQTTSRTNAELQRAAVQYNTQQKDPGDRVVCEYEEITGTRMKQKVCRTVSEMEKGQKEAQRAFRDVKSTEKSTGP